MIILQQQQQWDSYSKNNNNNNQNNDNVLANLIDQWQHWQDDQQNMILQASTLTACIMLHCYQARGNSLLLLKFMQMFQLIRWSKISYKNQSIYCYVWSVHIVIGHKLLRIWMMSSQWIYIISSQTDTTFCQRKIANAHSIKAKIDCNWLLVVVGCAFLNMELNQHYIASYFFFQD